MCRISLLSSLMAFGLTISLAVSAKAAGGLEKAEFYTETANDNKDKDTCIYVDVRSADGQTLLAHSAGAECSNDDKTEYKDGSTHSLALVVDSPNLTKESARGFKVNLRQTTHGSDTWKIQVARVQLYFGGGETLVAEKGGFQLKNNNASADFAAP